MGINIMQLCVWPALNPLSIHVMFTAIVPVGTQGGQNVQKMCQNGELLNLRVELRMWWRTVLHEHKVIAWTVCKLTSTWESNTTKMERDRWPTYKEGCFAVEKASSSSHKTGLGPIQHIFSWTLVKAADNWLNTSLLFCILTARLCLVS